MRVVISGLAVAALTTSIASAEPCARPADLSAFGVAGLKSQLMVTALTCSQQDRYNDFVHRFQTELMAHERALHGYFVRVFGAHGQKEHDDYITSLANAQSQSGIKQGTLYCTQNVGVFEEVLALPKTTKLADYAASKSLTQAIDLVACPAQGPVTRTAQASTTHR